MTDPVTAIATAVGSVAHLVDVPDEVKVARSHRLDARLVASADARLVIALDDYARAKHPGRKRTAMRKATRAWSYLRRQGETRAALPWA